LWFGEELCTLKHRFAKYVKPKFSLKKKVLQHRLELEIAFGAK